MTASRESRSREDIAADLYFIASEDHLRAEKSLILEAARALSTPSEIGQTNAAPQVPLTGTRQPTVQSTPAAAAPDDKQHAVKRFMPDGRLFEGVGQPLFVLTHDYEQLERELAAYKKAWGDQVLHVACAASGCQFTRSAEPCIPDSEFTAEHKPGPAQMDVAREMQGFARSHVGDIERAARVCDDHARMLVYNMDEKRVAMSCAERIRSLPSAIAPTKNADPKVASHFAAADDRRPSDSAFSCEAESAGEDRCLDQCKPCQLIETAATIPPDLLEQLITWTRQVGEQGPGRVARGIAAAARGFNTQLRECAATLGRSDRTAHTDHPLRHWDRTCPACIAEGTPSTTVRKG